MIVSRHRRSERGIVLALVLVVIFVLITAVYAFQRRATIDVTIASNRLAAGEADALARGGLRVAEVLVTIVRAKHAGAGAGEQAGDGDDTPQINVPLDATGDATEVDALWQGIGKFPIEIDEDRTLRIEIEDEGAKLNLNALVAASLEPPPDTSADDEDEGEEASEDDRDDEGEGASEDAVEYLTEVMQYVIDGMPADASTRAYDPKAIAENILDFIDADTTSVNGRGEDEYYRRQDPPYRAWNQPLASVDQLGLVEDVDPPLLDALRHYVTVHPIGGTQGINLNRAEPWVLKLTYTGTSGNRRLIDDRLAEDLYNLRNKDKLACTTAGRDPRCVALSEIGSGDLGNGDIFPPVELPAKPEVFRVVATATVGDITRRLEAIFDTRPKTGPQLLSWRRLRGRD